VTSNQHFKRNHISGRIRRRRLRHPRHSAKWHRPAIAWLFALLHMAHGFRVEAVKVAISRLRYRAIYTCEILVAKSAPFFGRPSRPVSFPVLRRQTLAHGGAQRHQLRNIIRGCNLKFDAHSQFCLSWNDYSTAFNMTSVISSCCGASGVNASAAISRSIIRPAGGARHACAAAIMRSSLFVVHRHRFADAVLVCQQDVAGRQDPPGGEFSTASRITP